MNWPNAAEFFAMGGYGFYVWGSFGVTAACIAVEVIVLAARIKQAKRALPSAADKR
jgi:heme exporter protein D